MKKKLSAIVSLLALLATGFAASANAQDKPGDAAAGQKKNAMCIGCHGIVGYQASFPEVHKVPMIAGQNAKYLATALAAYKKGDRKHPSMRGIAETLTDQDMADLAAFYESQGGPRPQLPATAVNEPGPIAADLLKRGNCAVCHGANFSTPIDASYPKLSGQHADYLYVALKAYATHGPALVGRNHAIMGTQVKAFNHAELKALSNYLASLPGDLKTVPQSKFR